MHHRITSVDDLPALGRRLRALDYSAPWVVTVAPEEEVRTKKANAYYWASVIDGVRRWQETQGLSYDPKVIHEYFKREYMGEDAVVFFGKVIFTPRHTANMTPVKFAEFVEWAQAHAIDKMGMPAEYLERNGNGIEERG